MKLLPAQIERAVECLHEDIQLHRAYQLKHFNDFRAVLAARPDTLQMFYNFSRAIRARGFTEFSADSIYQRMRWETAMEQGDGKGYKLNDHYRSRMARRVMDDDPSLRGFFETRGLRA